MRVARVVLSSALLVLVAACADRATAPSAPETPSPDFNNSSTQQCLGPDAARALIAQLVPKKDRNAVNSRYTQVLEARRIETARRHALQLVDYLLKKFFDDQLIGDQSADTRAKLLTLINGIFCRVGLPPLPSGVLDDDGAAAIVDPTDPTTTIVTGTEWAGVEIPAGAVPVTTLITIRRLPDFPSPLLTPFDTYPLYYEFTYNPGITFTELVLVGACLSNSVTPPDPSRLRLAHNVAPFTPGSVEILALETVPFLDCSDAGDVASSSSLWGFDLARGGLLLTGAVKQLLLPAPLHAATRRAGGVGGTVRNFSPFGLVDTLGFAEAASPLEQPGVRQTPVASPPAVRLLTPTGRAMEGLIVDFAKTPIGAVVVGTPATSNADGIAATTSWTLGKEALNEVTATVRAPAGTGFVGVPLIFKALVN